MKKEEIDEDTSWVKDTSLKIKSESLGRPRYQISGDLIPDEILNLSDEEKLATMDSKERSDLQALQERIENL